MARKRADGEGTISKRKDGLWAGALTIGYTATGKQKRRFVYARTQGECRTKLDELKTQLAQGVQLDKSSTVAEYLEQWLEHKETQVRPRTIEIYRTLIERHITPTIGRRKLDKLTPGDVQQLVTKVSTSVGAPTANKARRVLYGALKQAVRWLLIPRNPVEAVDPVKEAGYEMKLWTFEQAARFLDAARGHRLYAAFYLAMATGLRRGELLGLYWTDLNGDQLKVQRSLVRNDKGTAWSTPKTERGKRIVTIPTDAVTVLEDHRASQAREKAAALGSWGNDDLMFTNEIGQPITPISLNHAWTRLQQIAAVPHMRLHDLRHLHVSLLVRRGFDPRTIADRIGHTDASFTLRRYSHMFEEQRKAVAVPLEELLRVPSELN